MLFVGIIAIMERAAKMKSKDDNYSNGGLATVHAAMAADFEFNPAPLIGGTLGAGLATLALVTHFTATEAPKAPDTPVSCKPAVEQKAPKHNSGISHEQKLAQIATDHGLKFTV